MHALNDMNDSATLVVTPSITESALDTIRCRITYRMLGIFSAVGDLVYNTVQQARFHGKDFRQNKVFHYLPQFSCTIPVVQELHFLQGLSAHHLTRQISVK